ncbi:MAG: hypothetical protein JWM63_2146 [Gammaproteobacteria bacterium]|nr:hypothetical protein [Gammaproteobacteria bacterium]
MNAHPRPYYYLENFSLALGWLQSRYDELLSEQERAFVRDFARLPIESGALLARMITRQGDLFRTSKLLYTEIGCPKRAAAALIDLGWLDPRPLLTFPNLCRVLRKAELWSALALRGKARAVRKSELPPLVGEIANETRPLDAWWPEAPDQVFHITIAPLCERLRLMFFGNFRQTWSEFVLADLGIFRYESVSLDESARAFHTREQIEQFYALYRCRELVHAEAPLEEVLAMLPPPIEGSAWIEAKRAKLLFLIGQRYEKARELPQALAAYVGCGHPEARIRTIRVLEKLGRCAEAAELLVNTQGTPVSEFEAQQAARILPRLTGKLGFPVQRARVRDGWSSLTLVLPRPESPHPVELVVSEHLTTPQAPVLYVENTLFNSLFGLLCWDAIFAPLPGAFFHPFHSAPADLLDADFQQRRTALFSACFARLESGDYRAAILDTFERKNGIQSPFVAWGLVTRELLELALDCLPALHLRRCFARLLADLRSNRSGLPDLIQFWPAQRRYRLIEVKGPGDRLQDNQIRWLNFCVQQDIPVCVCNVTWQGMPS